MKSDTDTKKDFIRTAIAEKFRRNKIPFKEQLKAKIKMGEKSLSLYFLDFLVFDKIVIELKKRNYFSVRDINQLYGYLKATGLKLGLLIHFTNRGVNRRITNER